MPQFLLSFLKKYKFYIILILLSFSFGMYAEYKLFFPKGIEVTDTISHPTTFNQPKLTPNDFSKENYEKCIECMNSKIKQEISVIDEEWIRITAEDACKSTFTDYKIRTANKSVWGIGADYYFLYSNNSKEIMQVIGINGLYQYGKIIFKGGVILPISSSKIYGATVGVNYFF